LKAFELANRLHLEGIKTEIDYERRSLKAQMRRANKLNSRYVLIIGEEELKTGRAIFRDMARKDQKEINLNQVIEEIKGGGLVGYISPMKEDTLIMGTFPYIV